MAKVIEINDIHALGAYRYSWNQLFAQTSHATFFQTLNWLETYWQFYGDNKKLRVLIAQVGGQVIGILPLVEQTESTHAGSVRVLTYPLAAWGPFFGPIGGQPTATLYTCLQYLAGTSRTWDMLDFRWVETEIDRGRTFSAMRCQAFTPVILPGKPSYAIELPTDFENYLASRTPKFRAAIRRAVRKAEQDGVVAERYRPVSDRQSPIPPNETLYEECVQLAKRTWQGSSSTGTTISHEQTAAYFHECFIQAARLRMIDLMTLRYQDRLVAFSYNFHHQGRVLGIRMGYEPDCKHHSPGVALMGMQIRDSIERGDQLFDLGSDYPEIKAPWINRTLESQRICHYSGFSVLANVLRWGHWLKYRRAHAAV
ncbi:GNAT family N-acetyltransferase [Bremerella cremea]|uniref:GNAT family N-acetyltransferase n=1 Tax=Bremerella cremea TaxID=1031537 RepID=A0A368KW65_9BACT|nr:GNAT family N-acetyltransferase [Bremerella cremea]RCS54561.1 GNAT family N-acetyltransferase [Bremerella cremea]